ncbi:hypothetical protein QT995_03055 [Microcoleus sp. S36b_A3]|uniref:hypothetical protein n=1 Tax=unclassified Microcoleus TaxID=2642155 RepID=UPI002FD0A11E
MKKQFKANQRQEKGKRISPREIVDLPPEQESPLFSLGYMNKDYSLSQCTKDEKAAFADTLYKLSQLTWSQINASGRHGSGYEKIAKSSIRVAIPNHLKDDANFIAFRFCGMAPMVGYRDGAVLYIIWLDRDFTLYPH